MQSNLRATGVSNTSKREAGVAVFLIHGYTGTPHDFNELPAYLGREFGCEVKTVWLPGHGTAVQDLDNISYRDLVASVEWQFRAELARGRRIIVGGVSFGALLALRLAAEYPVSGVISINPPFSLRMPFNIPGIELLGLYKKYWKKRFSAAELAMRQGTPFYPCMHINGIAIVKRARRDVASRALGVTGPVITIHSLHDPVGSAKGVRLLERKMKNAPHEVVLYRNENHNVLYSDIRAEAHGRIGGFVRRIVADDGRARQPAVSAIVPAYNEAARLRQVLDALAGAPEISEIIVVDDGSSDGTAEAARQVPGVRVLVNERNQGKYHALALGVRAAQSDTLFFCDADLRGLSPEMVSAIVRPVVSGRCDMFIGMRSNLAQRAVSLFALNSGERALRRELWEQLPPAFRRRYRLEVGLNMLAALRGGRYGWMKLGYYQTFKEMKYGFWRGTLLRWRMNMDVLYAYVRALAMLLGRKPAAAPPPSKARSAGAPRDGQSRYAHDARCAGEPRVGKG